MEFNIGKLAKIFGLAPQTIHYYEKIGIINPGRNDNNGYRIYSDQNFTQLATIKKLRNAEFSLKDVSLLYDDDENELDIYKRYKKQREVLKTEIKRKELILEKLDEHIDQIEKLWTENEFVIEENSGYFRYNIKDLGIDDCYAFLWYENLFLTNSSIKFFMENDELRSFGFGLLASREIFFRCDLINSKNVDLIEKGRFATKIFKCCNEMNLQKIGNEVNLYLKNSGLKLRSYPFSELIASFYDDNKNKVNIVKIILPIF